MEGEADGEVEADVYRRAFESVGMPAMLMDEAFRIRAVNDAGVAFTGYDREALLGRETVSILADDATAVAIGERLLAGKSWNGDVRVRTADGRIVHGQGSAAPLDPTVGTDGGSVTDPSRLGGVTDRSSVHAAGPDATDATDDAGGGPATDALDAAGAADGPRTDAADRSDAADDTGDAGAETKRRPRYVAAFVDARQKRQYENAAEVLDRLLRHDLRNGLNLVYGYVQQARSRTNDPVARDRLADAREELSEILDKGERARDLRSLLDRAYEESTYPVRVDQVIAETVRKLDGVYPDALVETASLPAVRVEADDLLSEVLEGVIENGIVHDDGDPHVRVGVERTETTAVVSVADSGPGIPESRADEVFGRGQTDALHHGDGLSLFFADSVVRSYDGRIWFENHDDGTVFKIELSRTDALGDD
ncbi:MAG: ATP-binding protein [Halobaculum sp.]